MLVTPRVNSQMLASYKGKTVRLSAKVMRLEGDTAIVQASDGGQVELHLNRDAHLAEAFVEVIGKVQDDLSIKVLTDINMGDRLDLDLCNSVAKLMEAMKDDERSPF